MSALDTEQVHLDVETTTERASDEEVTTTVREYDTDKPTDPATGTPPLKRETTQTRRTADSGRQRQTTGQSTLQHRELTGRTTQQQAVQTAMQARSQKQEQADQTIRTHEKRGLNTWQRSLCTLGGLVALGALLWLARKLKRYL